MADALLSDRQHTRREGAEQLLFHKRDDEVPMKHLNTARRPTVAQKRKISAAGLIPWEWLVVAETKDKLRIVDHQGKAREIEGGDNKKRR